MPLSPRRARTRLAIAGAVGLIFIACSPVSVGGGGEVEPPVNSVEIAFAPERLDFSPQLVGATSSRAVELSNPGTEPGELELKVIGDGASAFSVAETALVLAPAAVRQLDVRFHPEAPGDFEAELWVSRGNVLVAGLPLTGSARAARCVVTPASAIDAGTVLVQGTRTLDVRLTNEGEIGFAASAELSSGDSSFTLEPAADGEVAPGATRTYRVVFAPKQPGPATAVLKLDAPGCGTSLELTGNGTDSLVSAPDLDFGYVHPGTSAVRKLRLANAGREPLTVSELHIAGGTEFSMVTAPDPLVLPAEGEVELEIGFAPSRLGVFVQQLRVTVDHPLQQTVWVSLRGTGGGPDIDVPGRVDFGTVGAGGWSIVRLPVLNAGTDVPGTTLDNLFLGGEAGGAQVAAIINDPNSTFSFVVTRYPSSGLAAGQSAELQVKAAPVTSGLHTALLQIFSNDPDEPVVTVQLEVLVESLPDCEYTLSPTRVDFGDVAFGGSVTRTVLVRNEGTSKCLISSPTLQVGEEFSLVAPPSGTTTLMPGETLALAVRYAPVDAGADAATLDLFLSNPTEPRVQAMFSGRGNPACLRYPRVVSFGEVQPGCGSGSQPLTIFNTCTSAITFTNVAVTGSKAFEAAAAKLPITVASDAALVLDTRFLPTAAGVEVGVLTVTAGGGQKLEIELQGDGLGTSLRRTSFTAVPEKHDVLFVVDDTNEPDLKNRVLEPLRNHATAFLSGTAASDFHLAVTTTSVCNGCPNLADGRFLPLVGAWPRVLSKTTPGVAQLFMNNLDVGTSGYAWEQLLGPMSLALTPSLLAGHNAGFLRSDARLHLVAIGNAPDASPKSAGYYEAIFAELEWLGRTRGVTVSGVIPTLSAPAPACQYENPNAGQHPLLRGVIERSGGLLQELCDFSGVDSVRALANAVFAPNLEYRLESTVDGEKPMSVQLNGRSWPEFDPQLGLRRWSLQPDGRTIRVEPSFALDSGDVLEVDYEAKCQP